MEIGPPMELVDTALTLGVVALAIAFVAARFKTRGPSLKRGVDGAEERTQGKPASDAGCDRCP